MAIKIIEKIGDIKIYGEGLPGGKGAGLVKINECDFPMVKKLKTHILTTTFFDRFLESGESFQDDELKIVGSILEDMGDLPIGVRSSATNEAGIASEGAGPVHAGEHMSFMLPNNHPDHNARFNQLVQAIDRIYDHFIHKVSADRKEKMAIVINPIPGIFDDTLAGPFYYPYISGIASSFFPHALKTQDPKEGFARIAFGHGYATVLDDFPVISMATIRNPLPLELLRIGKGQQFFYALDMTKNREIKGEELETMKKLHVRFANYHKIKLLGLHDNLITIEELIQNDHFGFKTGLAEIMEIIFSKISSHFLIEFVFNIDFNRKDREDGFFHIVQLTQLPALKFEAIHLPANPRRTYLSIVSLQGHGIKRDIRHAVVLSPFAYSREMHDAVIERLAAINQKMRRENEQYIIIIPGRLGSKNRDWGIDVDFKDVDRAAAIFEYGVDIAGRAEPLFEERDLTGGIYGSHFLYMIQGGYDEEQKQVQTRVYGTQGTHFLTNLMSNNIIYGYIAPMQDTIDPWFFSGSGSDEPISVLSFPGKTSIYADTINQRCMVVSEDR